MFLFLKHRFFVVVQMCFFFKITSRDIQNPSGLRFGLTNQSHFSSCIVDWGEFLRYHAPPCCTPPFGQKTRGGEVQQGGGVQQGGPKIFFWKTGQNFIRRLRRHIKFSSRGGGRYNRGGGAWWMVTEGTGKLNHHPKAMFLYHPLIRPPQIWPLQFFLVSCGTPFTTPKGINPKGTNQEGSHPMAWIPPLPHIRPEVIPLDKLGLEK